MPKTMFDKIWEAHEVSDGLIYIDLHLVHEVTSPQAFDGLRLADRPVRRPTRPWPPPTTTRPTDGTMAARLIADQLSRVQVETLERNCEEFGIPIYSLGSDRQGIVHVIGPELGVTQPGMTIVCGDSHTSTHGAFGALAFGIGTSEVEHVLATQCLVQKRPKTMRINYSGELRHGRHPEGPDPGDDRPPRHRRHDRLRGRVRRAGDRGALDAGPDDDLQHDDRGRRPGRDDRPRRDHLRVGQGPPGGARPTSTPRSARWRELPTEPGASFDTEVEVDAVGDLADGHLGHQPGHGRRGHRPRPRPGGDGLAGRPRSGRARPRLHGPGGRHADDRGRPRTGLHRLLHQLADRGPARGGGDRRRPQGRRPASARWSSPAPSR